MRWLHLVQSYKDDCVGKDQYQQLTGHDIPYLILDNKEYISVY